MYTQIIILDKTLPHHRANLAEDAFYKTHGVDHFSGIRRWFQVSVRLLVNVRRPCRASAGRGAPSREAC